MANTNPGGLNLNVNPYFDDYDEDRKFVRVLYVPGRAVQARELTQMQSIQQKQIERFANYFFKQGSIVEGCEQFLDLNMNFLKLETTYNGTEVDVEDFESVEIVGANTGIKAYVGLVSDLESTDPKTLFINYLTTGAVVLTVNTAPSTLTVGNTINLSSGGTGVIRAFDTSFNKIFVTSGNGTFSTGTGNTVLNTGSTQFLSISAVNDFRANTTFANSEIIFTAPTSGRVYAQGTSDAVRYVENAGLSTEAVYTKGSKITLSDGVVYIADHFVKNTSQTLILDKYKNVPSYKIGLVPTKTFIDYIEDGTLVDNAQGTPNFQAPGADRLKIDVTLTKLALDATTDETEFISLLEVENGISRKRRPVQLESKIEEVIAKRTFEESGNYTLSDPKINLREHLVQGTNGGRFTSAEGGNNDLLLIEVDPFTAYVNGFRNEFITKQNVTVEKGLDTQYVEQTKTQINTGSYVEVKELVGSFDFMESTLVDLYDTPQQAITTEKYSVGAPTGNVIGTARVKSIEFVSGTTGTADARYYLYLYDITMNAGEVFDDVRSIYDSSTPSRYADVVLNTLGNAVLQEQSFNKAIFNLPYSAIKTIRDDGDNVETGFRFKKEYSVTFTNGIATISTTDASETFVGTGTLSTTQKNDNYLVVINNSGANVETTALTGTVTVSSGNANVVGSSTAFTTQLNVGDTIKINSEQKKISSITNNTFLTLTSNHTAGASANTFTKILPAGQPVYLSGNGGSGATRTVTVSSPGTIQIDIKEVATFTAKVITTMDRSNAREMRKILQFQSTTQLNPNTHPSGLAGPFGLGRADVYQLHAIYKSSGFGVTATTSNTDVTSDYTFDNGQRDNSYEHATITPKIGVVPTGNLLVVYDNFTHDTTQGVGYLSVNSYPVDDDTTSNTTINTADIPVYTSTTTGVRFDLRDCIDFRPIKTANTSTNPIDTGTYQVPTGGLHIPTPGSDFDADLIYYKGRIAKLYVDSKGLFGINDGSPGYPIPIAPPALPDTLEIAELDIPPYPSSPNDVGVRLFKNKRFTMKDIGKLEDRINKLEYYTALNLLEKQATDKVILDDQGLDRFKNGILVDPFTGFNVADVNNSNYKASIDRDQKILSAYASKTTQLPLEYTTTGSSGVTRYSGNKLMLSQASTETFIVQPYASSALNLAQTLTYTWIGDAKVYPTSDNWINTTNDPNLNFVVDFTQQSDNWRSLADAWNVEGAPLTRFWTGIPQTTTTSLSQSSATTTTSAVSRDVLQTTQTAFVERSSLNVQPEQTTSIDRVVDVSVNIRMRQRDFIISATGLKDGSPLYAFFDGVDVTANCTQISLVGSTTVSDLFDTFNSNGLLPSNASKYNVVSSGSIRANDGKALVVFRVPANSFNIGQREFKLTDSSTNSDSTTTTFARAFISASGISLLRNNNVINTRPTEISFDDNNLRSSVSRQVRDLLNVERRVLDLTSNAPRRTDPLAQSFYVDEAFYLNGVFASSIDLYFKSKSSDSNIGVMVEIREMENGFPTRKVLGGSKAHLYSTSINTSATAATATTFTFDAPVFLLPGREYCFSVKPDGNSTDFEIWAAEIGQLDVSNPDNPSRIDKQPENGILFTPSNDYTWSVRQTQDLKYTMRVAKFASSGTVILQNKSFTGNNTPYSTFTLNIEDFERPGTTLNYNVRVADTAYTLTDYFAVKNREKIIETSLKQLANTTNETAQGIKSVGVRSTLSTTDTYITPYIDIERMQVVVEDFTINNLTSTPLTGTSTFTTGSANVVGSGTTFTTEVSAGEYVKFGSNQYRLVTSVTNNTFLTVATNFTANGTANTMSVDNEENPAGPYASSSRYISRRVVLNDGFEASDLAIYLDINRPAGTDVKVYYKILNENDIDQFDDKFYTEMSLSGTKIFTENTNSYTEEKYIIPASLKIGGTELLSGTVAISNTNTNVNGTSTRFIEDLRIGDTIAVGTNREERVVTTIANNTNLTVDSVFSTVNSGLDIFKKLNNSVQYTTPSNKTYSGFKYFAVKVVFLSDNTVKSSKVKNLRVIALA